MKNFENYELLSEWVSENVATREAAASKNEIF